MAFINQHSGTIESLHKVRGTFKNTGGGDGSYLPVKYLPETERISKAIELMEFLEGKSAYRPTSVIAYVAVTDEEIIPVDPGSEPKDVNFNFRVKLGSDPIQHKESFFVPGVIAANAGAVQAMGEAMATLLSTSGVEYTFTTITGTRR